MANNMNMCPRCGNWLSPISERTGGFSGGKAVIVGLLLGPIALAAGAIGKKKTTYQCSRCGYTVEK